MTLTIELDLDVVQADLHVKFLVHTSNGSVVRVLTDGYTDRQTDWTNSITSTADAEGNKQSVRKFSLHVFKATIPPLVIRN